MYRSGSEWLGWWRWESTWTDLKAKTGSRQQRFSSAVKFTVSKKDWMHNQLNQKELRVSTSAFICIKNVTLHAQKYTVQYNHNFHGLWSLYRGENTGISAFDFITSFDILTGGLNYFLTVAPSEEIHQPYKCLWQIKRLVRWKYRNCTVIHLIHSIVLESCDCEAFWHNHTYLMGRCALQK